MDSIPMKPVTPGPAEAGSSKMKDKSQHIQVFVRVRPMNSFERSKFSHTVLDCPGTKEVVVKERNQRSNNLTKTFTFDKVFCPNSKQIEVYKSVVAPLLEEVLLGYNCTVFAYGQTGTGKTFTMEGDRQYDNTLGWDKDPMSGIVPRALNQLFDQLRMQKAEFTVRVSLLELYNEELFDLLASTEDMKLRNLRLYEDNTRKGSVVIQGLEEVTVHDKHEVYAIMERGALKRQTAATLMNEKSSRSHTVFTVTVHIKESNLDGEELLKIGKLHLVDLAGSENIGRSGAVDKRAREAGSINQSLLTLGRVITALVERTPHVPYRESKLTRILQDSLGGRTKTSIIATVSPASINIEETLSTLDYAHRAKNITNRPEINQKLTKKAILKAYTEEIEQLKKDLAATREKNGIFLDKGNYERMINQIDSQGQDISERISLIKSLEEAVEKKEEELESTKEELTEKEEILEAANQVIEKLKLDLRETEDELKLTRLQRDEKDHLVWKHMETEAKLSSEASRLLETANSTTVSMEKLYFKLERKRRVEESNLDTGRRFRGDLTGQLMSSIESFEAFRTEHAKLSGGQRLDLELFLHTKNSQFEKLKESLANLSEQGGIRLANMTKLFTKHVYDTNTWAEVANITVENQKQSLFAFYENLLKDFVSIHDTLSTIISEMNQTHQKFVNETLVFIKDSESGFEIMLKDLINLIDTTWASVDEYINVHDQDIISLQTEISNLKLARDSHESNFETEMQKLEKSVTAIKKAHRKHHKEFIEKSANLESIIEKRDQEGKCFTTKIKDSFEIKKGDTESLITEACVPFETFRSNMAAGNSAYVALTFNAQNALAEQLDEAKKAFKTAEEMHNDIIKTLKLQNKSLGQGASFTNEVIKKDINEVTSLVHLKAVELEEEGKAGLNTDTSMFDKLMGEIHEECNWVSTWTDSQRNKTSQQLGMLSEYFDSTYLVDSPTGATPQRRLYEYPRKLTTTSPHESILSRFRSTRGITRSSLPETFRRNLATSDVQEESNDGQNSGSDDVDLVPIKEINTSGNNRKNNDGDGEILTAVNKENPKVVVNDKEHQLSCSSRETDKENVAVAAKPGKGNGHQSGTSKERGGKSKEVLSSKKMEN